MIKEKKAIFWAVLAAVLYATSAPASKILLQQIPPALLAGLLYLGAGLGMGIWGMLCSKTRSVQAPALGRRDLPYVIAMIVLDIAAPLLLLWGLNKTTAAHVALINNFEIASTAIIALGVFKEKISVRLWVAIGLVSLACIILSVKDSGSFSFSPGSAFVILACICWGMENNCTRMISNKNPLEIVVVKGLGSGTGALLIAYFLGKMVWAGGYMWAALGLGFVAYGLSIFFYVLAQRELGAAKTSTYYAAAPFVGVIFSLLIFKEIPSLSFWVALVIMLAGSWLAATDDKYTAVNKR